ncbi:phosphate propanoyltransferase [Veillonella intestinalis]|uniref:phosphate propanoyltransferase n=1 Tax=Veillonella intestinalis TaxID=2941341 RepID=UPI0020407461|nr:phosphate propanoyltransferase [Veillonella intestinalis]
MNLVDDIVSKVLKQLEEKSIENNKKFIIEGSGRHIHLSQNDVDRLFGEGYQLTKVKDLSQPGQYVCQERVNLVGPKGMFTNVVILGPVREQSQVEVSLTDARTLGIKAPVRESGDLKGSAGIIIVNKERHISLTEGCIVAKRHVHVAEDDAKILGVRNGQIVKVRTNTARPLIFDDVVIRVSPKYHTYMHIDFDEANACGLHDGDFGEIIE